MSGSSAANRGPFAGPQSEDEPFNKAVGSQTVRTVQAARADFTGGPQTGERGAAVLVDREAADHVMSARSHGNQVVREIEPELRAHLADMGEPLVDDPRGQMRQIEVDARVPRLCHLGSNGAAHHVARRELQGGIVIPHEAVARHVAQVGAFATSGFGDQVASVPAI